MFFLGISAHLIIYLLVPAFLMICLCFTGQAGNPEVPIILPVCITYEPAPHAVTDRETYYYTETEQQQDQAKVKEIFVDTDTPLPVTFLAVRTQHSENDKHLLRAPPVKF